MHADHHLGTTSVIKSWCKANYGDDYYQPELQKVSPVKQPHGPDFQVLGEKRLFVASNHAMIQWLQEYSSVEDFGYNKLIPLSVRVALPGSPHSTILDWKGIQVGFDTLDPRLSVPNTIPQRECANCHPVIRPCVQQLDLQLSPL